MEVLLQYGQQICTLKCKQGLHCCHPFVALSLVTALLHEAIQDESTELYFISMMCVVWYVFPGKYNSASDTINQLKYRLCSCTMEKYCMQALSQG